MSISVVGATQAALFDYGALDETTRVFVQEKAQAIHVRLKRTAEDIIIIGQDLSEVKQRLLHGQFKPWLQSEFQMSYPTAVNFMRVAERFGKNINFIHLPISVLYELAAPSTPDTIIEMVESGEIASSLPAIREAKRELQQSIPQEGATEVISASQFVEELTSSKHPPGWGLVNGKPFTMPLPDGKPVELPEEWKLPRELRTDSSIEKAEPVVDRSGQVVAWIADSEGYTTTRETARGVHDDLPLPIHRGVPAALQMSESNEWFTPAAYVDAARELMGGEIDVDPASNEYANRKVVRASTYYDIQTNGLEHEWHGRVWLNPPYGFDSGRSNQEIWTQRLIEQYNAGITTEAVLLVNANTEAKWFQPLYEYLLCFTHHRIRFYNGMGESSQPTQGNAFVYLGKQEARFIALFKQFGVIMRRTDR